MEFNEKAKEYSTKSRVEIPVWKSPKYEESKKKAIEMIESKKYDLSQGDFWILMNESRAGDKMVYTGLIISHNGCLKINDKLEEEKKFRSECLTRSEMVYAKSLVYEYNCPEQGLYEVGEVNETNCKNAYPFAMAFKRCFDRVVLKNSKLAYAGIYSEAEADEFKEPAPEVSDKITQEQKDTLTQLGVDLETVKTYCKVESIDDIPFQEAHRIIRIKSK